MHCSAINAFEIRLEIDYLTETEIFFAKSTIKKIKKKKEEAKNQLNSTVKSMNITKKKKNNETHKQQLK